MIRDGLLQYNKNTSDKRRPLMMVSPQERQRRAASAALADPIIKELSEKLSELADDMLLIKKGNEVSIVDTTSKFYSEEEFNEELTKALEKEIESISKSETINVTELDKLKLELVGLKKQIEIKDNIIAALKTLEIKTTGVTTQTSVDSVDVEDAQRPSIQDRVIDPSDDEGLESFIEIDAVKDTASSKDVVSDKLSKLKSLLG